MEYFQDPAEQRFSFVSHAAGLGNTTFAVLRFKGFESISSPYEFDIMLVSGEGDLNLSDVLQSQAAFTIHRDDGDDVIYNGILAEFDQLHAYNDHYFYRARLVPKLWWLMQTQHNQVFLDQSAPEIIERALADGGMDSLDYDLGALEGSYAPLDYVCQYSESHFNFISRWMEREGIYYYFFHSADGDKLVLSDSAFSHEPHRQGADLVYSPLTGLEHGRLNEIIHNFTCRQKQLPRALVLKDHNPERPSLEMTVRTDLDPDGRGETFIYGEHYNTPEEGERLLNIRAEELLCQKQAFYGDSTVPFLAPGFKFNLSQHYRDAYNQEYMVTEVTHEGDQTNLLKTSVIGSLNESAEVNRYSNNFRAIPADIQYRHPRTANRPKVSGTLHGKIDGEQESRYPQLDEEGRYKVRLPFDINDERMDGKASARIRMMQPYAGEDRGMQFPLAKGTEVLLSFIDGNPDRPVIAGAISTPTAPGPVNSDNQSESVIRSAGNNRIRMEDKSGSERIVLQSASAGTWFRIGAPNDPMVLNGESPAFHQAGETWTDPGAKSVHETEETITNERVDAEWLRKASEVDNEDADDFLGKSLDEGEYIAQYPSGGSEPLRRKVWAFERTDVDSDYYKKRQDGVRQTSAGALWTEARNRFGSYIVGYPDDQANADDSDDDRKKVNPDGRSYTGTMLRNYTNGNYAPTGMRDYADTDKAIDDFEYVLNNAHVTVSSFDTVNTQEGNIYDFGGYWNYNLGNSYEENHIKQDAKLNRDGSLDKGDKDSEDVNFGDILNKGGPNWDSIEWPTPKGIQTQLDGTWDGDHVWTDKSFGKTYSYTNGDSVSVTNGSSLDISYVGHRQVEVVLRGEGDPASWTHSEGGITKEKKWDANGTLYLDSITTVLPDSINEVATKFDRNTGGVQNFSASASTGMATSSFEFDYANSATSNISVASSLSFNMSASASIGMSITATMKLALDITALELDLKAPFSGITVSSTRKGATSISTPGCSIEIEGPGPTIKVEGAAPKFTVSAADFKQVVSDLSWKNVNLAGGLVKIFG